MLRRLPLFPTLLVLAAVAVMIRLGLWQLERMHQKEVLLAQYATATAMSSDVAIASDPALRERQLFRHTAFRCDGAGMTQPTAGHSADGRTGWAHWARCPAKDSRPAIDANVGWSPRPQPVAYAPMEIRGVLAPDAQGSARVVADSALPGLTASARPDPANIPNNHWSYAIQWFLFAATALVIYALALRKRLASSPERGGEPA